MSVSVKTGPLAFKTDADGVAAIPSQADGCKMAEMKKQAETVGLNRGAKGISGVKKTPVKDDRPDRGKGKRRSGGVLKTPPDQLVSKGTFARRTGVAASRVSQWIDAGMPVTKSGKIDVAQADRWLKENLDHARRGEWAGDGERLKKMPKAKGARGNPGGRGAKIVRFQNGTAQPTLDEIGIEKNRSSRAQKRDTLADARRARENIRGEREKLALSRDRGELVDRSLVRRFLEARGRLDRDANLAWVSRTSALLAGEFGIDPAKLFARMDQEMRTHLGELASTPIPESEGIA